MPSGRVVKALLSKKLEIGAKSRMGVMDALEPVPGPIGSNMQARPKSVCSCGVCASLTSCI